MFRIRVAKAQPESAQTASADRYLRPTIWRIVEVFNPGIRGVAVHHTLADRHEHAQDKNVLFAARHLNVFRVARSKGDRPAVVVDIEIKVGITSQV